MLQAHAGDAHRAPTPDLGGNLDEDRDGEREPVPAGDGQGDPGDQGERPQEKLAVVAGGDGAPQLARGRQAVQGVTGNDDEQVGQAEQQGDQDGGGAKPGQDPPRAAAAGAPCVVCHGRFAPFFRSASRPRGWRWWFR